MSGERENWTEDEYWTVERWETHVSAYVAGWKQGHKDGRLSLCGAAAVSGERMKLVVLQGPVESVAVPPGYVQYESNLDVMLGQRVELMLPADFFGEDSPEWLEYNPPSSSPENIIVNNNEKRTRHEAHGRHKHSIDTVACGHDHLAPPQSRA